MLTLVAAIFVFGLIIFVHEFGHYLAARRAGIKVLELALGFGPRLLGWSRDGTDYSLRAVPLGGFCRMLGEDEDEQDKPGNFMEKPVRSRIGVVAAGSLMNFVLAILLIFVVYFFLLGMPAEDTTEIGQVSPDFPAAEAGLQEGDHILAVEGESVNEWQDLSHIIGGKYGENISLTVERNGRQKTFNLTPVVDLSLLGMAVEDNAEIGHLAPELPADEAGLQEGDRIVAVEGKPVDDLPGLVSIIENRPGEEVNLTVVRDGEEKTFNLVPAYQEQLDGVRGIIGIGPPTERFSFFRALGTSFSYIYLILESLYLTISGQIPLDVAGPVGIIDFVGEAAATGFANLLMLTALISFSVGLINILPVPALDGGRLLFLGIEGVRGKPMDPEKEGLIHMIGFAVLIALILIVTYHDLLRLDIFG